MVDRVTHAYDGPLAVFLIGLRVHKPWRLGVVGPTFRAMPRMLAELERNKAAAARGEEVSLGFLAGRSTVNGFGTTMIQWWRSVDDIYAYANAPDLAHRPAWLAFHRAARQDPSAVTIWHETYVVSAAESLYAGPAPFGLASVAGTVPAGRRGESARERLGSSAADPLEGALDPG